VAYSEFAGILPEAALSFIILFVIAFTGCYNGFGRILNFRMVVGFLLGVMAHSRRAEYKHLH
jgi:hypothetical protein